MSPAVRSVRYSGNFARHGDAIPAVCCILITVYMTTTVAAGLVLATVRQADAQPLVTITSGVQRHSR